VDSSAASFQAGSELEQPSLSAVDSLPVLHRWVDDPFSLDVGIFDLVDVDGCIREPGVEGETQAAWDTDEAAAGSVATNRNASSQTDKEISSSEGLTPSAVARLVCRRRNLSINGLVEVLLSQLQHVASDTERRRALELVQAAVGVERRIESEVAKHVLAAKGKSANVQFNSSQACYSLFKEIRSRPRNMDPVDVVMI